MWEEHITSAAYLRQEFIFCLVQVHTTHRYGRYGHHSDLNGLAMQKGHWATLLALEPGGMSKACQMGTTRFISRSFTRSESRSSTTSRSTFGSTSDYPVPTILAPPWAPKVRSPRIGHTLFTPTILAPPWAPKVRSPRSPSRGRSALGLPFPVMGTSHRHRLRSWPGSSDGVKLK